MIIEPYQDSRLRGNDHRGSLFRIPQSAFRNLQVRVDIPEYGLQAFFFDPGFDQFLPLFHG